MEGVREAAAVAGTEQDEERFSLLGRRLPAGVRLRLVRIAASGEHPYRSGEWRGALVVVEQGAIVLVTVRGERLPLAGGAVLWLAGLPLRALVNPHPETALLSVLSRCDGTDGGEKEHR